MTTTSNTPTPPPPAARGLLGTVWEDGSSFDYENGYSANGATPETKRTKPAKFSKSTRANNSSLLALGVVGIVILSLLTVMVLSIMLATKAGEAADRNNAAIKEYIHKQDGLYVVDMKNEKKHSLTNEVILQNNDGNIFKCDVEAADNEFMANAYVFCGPAGDPATFNIALPEKVSFTSLTQSGAAHK